MNKNYLDPKQFMLADDLMTNIMGALAHGHKELVTQSNSNLGTLAVKSAQLNVSFDFSVVEKNTGERLGLTVRPSPFFGFAAGFQTEKSEQSASISNRATITIDIVNVAPLSDTKESDTSSGEDTEEGTTGNTGNPPVRPYDKERLKILLDELLAFIKRDWPSILSSTETLVNEIEVYLRTDEVRIAGALITKLTGDLYKAFQATNTRMSRELEAVLGNLDAFLSGIKLTDELIPSNTRDIIESLPRQFGLLDLSAEILSNFDQQIKAVLGSDSEIAAGLILQRAIAELAPHLSGKILPKKLLDSLEELRLLKTLDISDMQWKQAFESSVRTLRTSIRTLQLPEDISTGFEADCDHALASHSAIEAGSRLVVALDTLNRTTQELPLSQEIQKVLEQFVQPAITNEETL
ncbi:MAG: hypothetical protein ACHWZW_20620 [Spirulina sp.]